MPPKNRFTRQQIVEAALGLVREEGAGALTARGVAARLGASPKVIFGLFRNMEELQREVLGAADALYQGFLQREMASGRYPPYKASGMGYIRFALEERELFKLLFMRDRSAEQIPGMEGLRPLIGMVEKATGLNEQQAALFHLEMWVWVHGVATMLATGYLPWDWGMISSMMTDIYEGMRLRAERKEGMPDGGHQNGRADKTV